MLHLTMMLVITFLYTAFIMYICIWPLSLVSTALLSWMCARFCQGLFQHLMAWPHVLYLSVWLYGGLYCCSLLCWTIPASLEWSLVDHDKCFWWLLRFWFPVFYLVFCINIHMENWSEILPHVFVESLSCGLHISMTVAS